MQSIAEKARLMLGAGRADQAIALLNDGLRQAPRSADLRALLASALARAGRKADAMTQLEAALEQRPDFRDARLQLARLANETGAQAAAEKHARMLVDADGTDAEALAALGVAQFGLGRKRAAASALERAVRLRPGYAAAQYNLASILCDLEQSEEALAAAEQAQRAGSTHRGVALVRARCHVQLDELERAAAVLAEVLSATPRDVAALALLARVRHLRGDADSLRELRARAGAEPASLDIALVFADCLRRSGELEQAAAQLRALIARHGPSATLLGSLATCLQESGRVTEAVDAAATALAAAPNVVNAENFVAAALSAGDAARAVPVIENMRALLPLDARWITYRIDAARLLGERQFDSWFDVERLVRVVDLDAPPGYPSLAAFHAELREVLMARHRHERHPLDQSLRNGSQTSRSLLVRPAPPVEKLLAQFTAQVHDYQRALGAEPAHPLAARNRSAAEIVGCWSVRLRRRGFHVNHIHPEGWVSSAYYVEVPEETRDATARRGWLALGEPRFAIPGVGPLHHVQPRPGRLVLFPSYMWHGTVALEGDAPRMSVAFDAVPGAELG